MLFFIDMGWVLMGYGPWLINKHSDGWINITDEPYETYELFFQYLYLSVWSPHTYCCHIVAE